jgi:hypothetical protein
MAPYFYNVASNSVFRVARGAHRADRQPAAIFSIGLRHFQ